VSPTAITHFVASQRLFIIIFVIDSVRKFLGTPSYGLKERCFLEWLVDREIEYAAVCFQSAAPILKAVKEKDVPVLNYHTIKTYRTVTVELHAFLTLALYKSH
jgi:hypothetical protein